MSKCSTCRRNYPDDLISPMAVGDEGGLVYKNLCPPCALDLSNKTHGLKRTGFSPGSVAQSMLDRALAYNANRAKQQTAPRGQGD